MLQCPKCKSVNVNQYKMMTGKIWCVKCGFTVDKKEEDNPFQIDKNNPKFEDMVKKAKESLDQDMTINKMEQIRAKNNGNWMDLVRIALKYAPTETKEVLKKITNHDKEITSLIEKLSR